MKKILFLLCFASCLYGCKATTWPPALLDDCLSDFSSHSFYIALKIETENGTYPCVIRNLYLRQYYSIRHNMTRDQYKLTAKALILHNQVLKVKSEDLKEFDFKLVDIPSPITKELEKGKDYIINEYFRKNEIGFYQKPNFPLQYRYEIIYKLFSYKILVASNDESGLMYVWGEDLP